MAHEANADALVDDDSCGVLSVLSYEADALDESGVDCRVVLLLFDAAVSMVAPHRWSRAGEILLSARLAYGSGKSQHTPKEAPHLMNLGQLCLL